MKSLTIQRLERMLQQVNRIVEAEVLDSIRTKSTTLSPSYYDARAVEIELRELLAREKQNGKTG